MYDFKRLVKQEPAILVGLVEAFIAFLLLVWDVIPAEVVAGGLAFLSLLLNAAYVRAKTVTKEYLNAHGSKY